MGFILGPVLAALFVTAWEMFGVAFSQELAEPAAQPVAGGRHARPASRRAEPKSSELVLVLVYMVAEVVGGLLSNSLALLADAGHMLSDAGALGLALFANWFSRRPATSRHTFGYYRAEILAAVVNAGSLIAIAVFIFIEAYRRFQEPHEVAGGIMVGVAIGGLVVNLAGLWLLHGGRDENLNAKGAWLHVMTDTLGSVQAIVAGGLILAFGWNWLDPLASVLIGIRDLFVLVVDAGIRRGADGERAGTRRRGRGAELPDADSRRAGGARPARLDDCQRTGRAVGPHRRRTPVRGSDARPGARTGRALRNPSHDHSVRRAGRLTRFSRVRLASEYAGRSQ